ncbi:MAG: CvpA family protein [Anaerovoracaceae bacterium]
MFLDIAVIGILALFIAKGIFRGFVYTFIHTLGWIGAMIISFLAAKPLALFLNDGFLGIAIRDGILRKLSGSSNALEETVSGLPDIISGGISSGIETASEVFANMLSSVVLTMLSFLIIMAASRFLLRIVVKPASRRYGGGILTAADKALGALAGALEGILLVFVFLTVMMVLASISQEGISEIIVQWLNSSMIAKTLYDNNLLMLVTGGFFG